MRNQIRLAAALWGMMLAAVQVEAQIPGQPKVPVPIKISEPIPVPIEISASTVLTVGLDAAGKADSTALLSVEAFAPVQFSFDSIQGYQPPTNRILVIEYIDVPDGGNASITTQVRGVTVTRSFAGGHHLVRIYAGGNTKISTTGKGNLSGQLIPRTMVSQ